MCRWLGYVGSPIRPAELLYDPERSLIEQSRTHAPGMAVPNGDGTGLGWYGRRDVPSQRAHDPSGSRCGSQQDASTALCASTGSSTGVQGCCEVLPGLC